MNRIFLLSPARLDGVRGRHLFAPRTPSALSGALRTREGAAIGEVFTYLSGLYFRGKLTYARRFARPPLGWVGTGALVITANRGIVPAETRVCLEHLEAFAETDIGAKEKAFTVPFARDVGMLAREDAEIVLLGSIASAKYVDVLVATLGERLLFPSDFVGRGDMSRGGLLLRAAAAGEELAYAPVGSTVRKGKRPPKLTPARR